MDTLKDIIKYIFVKYPHKGELSKARLVKMIYLSDWKSCLLYGKQLTSIQWYYNHYGPYVPDVITLINNDDDFIVKHITNMFGEPKDLIFMKDNVDNPIISDTTSKILDFVIEKTHFLNWSEFISLIYSTYPVVTQKRYSLLNLEELAKLYNPNS